jgi:hypothetical protein
VRPVACLTLVLLTAAASAQTSSPMNPHVLPVAPDAAEVQGVPVRVLAPVSLNFGVQLSYSSAPILVTVRR